MRSNTKEIFVKRLSVEGYNYGEIILITSKKPLIGKGVTSGIEMPLNKEKISVLKGIALPICKTTMNNILNQKLDHIVHKIDKHYTSDIPEYLSFHVFFGRFTYIKLYDYYGRSIFVKPLRAKRIFSLNEWCIKIDFGEIFYEKFT